MEKTCTNCLVDLPLDDEHFHRNVAAPDGYVSRCRICMQMVRIVQVRNEGKILTFFPKEPKEGFKFCSNCQNELPAATKYFALDNSKRSGFCSCCKVCEQMYQLARYATCGEKVRTSNATWLKNNQEQKKQINRQYVKSHRAKLTAGENRRRAAKLQATPIWSQTEQIVEFYKNCPKGYQVDHVIALKGEEACGLHVLANLQYLSAVENQAKGNKLLDIYRFGLVK